MKNHVQIIREILLRWEQGPQEIIQAWRDHCQPGFIWWNSGRGAINGLDAAIEQIEGMRMHLSFSHMKAPVRHCVSLGSTVMVERIDELYDKDGALVVAVPVVGVIEFDGEKIREWRDYCDDWVLKKQLREDRANTH